MSHWDDVGVDDASPWWYVVSYDGKDFHRGRPQSDAEMVAIRQGVGSTVVVNLPGLVIRDDNVNDHRVKTIQVFVHRDYVRKP